MIKSRIYTFYSDEELISTLKKSLNIVEELQDNPTICRMEPATNTFANQIKEAKWSEVGIGRHTVLFYLDYYVVDDDDNDPVQSVNFKQVHIIIRHDTKSELAEKATESIQNMLNNG